jgi:ABC-type transport system involved in multi-copper enzyme maturation permease subunit
MTRLLNVEFFKLRKRLMTWVIAAVLVGLVGLLYIVLWDASGEATKVIQRRFTGADLRRVLYTQYAVPFSLQIVGFFGIVLAVIFAAGAAGGEYAWGTVRLMTTRARGRLQLLSAKLIVVCLMVLVGSLLAVLVGILISTIITQSSGGADYSFVNWTFIKEQFLAYGRANYVLAPYVAMAFCLAIVFRSTLAGVGTGLGVALIGRLIAELMLQGGEPWASLPKYFIHMNSDVIMTQNAVPRPLPRFGPGISELARDGAFSPHTAAIVLAVYVIAFIAIAFIVYRYRDITAGT